MQVYTAFYVATADDKPVHILIFRKRMRGYFFDQKAPILAGTALNGGGKYAFPGGKKNHDEKGDGLVKPALREWKEETGVDLDGYAHLFFAPAKVKNFGVINANLAEGEIKFGNTTGLDALKALRDRINANLAEAANAANDVRNGNLSTWQAVKATYPNCPDSNELETAEIWDTTTHAVQIKALGADTDTDWFYAFLAQSFPKHIK